MAVSLQVLPFPPAGFPDRHCDWQEVGYPQGNPSSCLGDPPPPPHCCLLLNSIGNQGWQPPVGGRGRFPWQPSAALSWLGREGRRPRKNSCRRALCEAATLVCWGKALMTPLFQIRAALSLRPFLPMFKKEPMAFKGGTSLEPQSLSRDSSPLVPEALTYSIGDNDLSLPLF